MTYGTVDNYKIWGKPAKYIKTEEGSLLLYSGFWGLARHFNYVGIYKITYFSRDKSEFISTYLF